MRIEDFDEAVREGWLTRKERGDLLLYCYTPQCIQARNWTPITRAARGITLERSTDQIIARPFPKFFNLGEMPESAPESLPAGSFNVEEKLDGSLGVVFHDGSKWDIATRGAFESPQAEFARARLLSSLDLSRAPGDHTLLFEILYPKNRIVVNYGGRTEMVLLGAIHTETGAEVDREALSTLAGDLGASLPETYSYDNVLDLPFPEDGTQFEGYIIRFDDGFRVKVKSPHYVKLTQFLEYRSPKRVLDMIANGTVESVREEIPKEIAGDFDDVVSTLQLSIRQLQDEANRAFEAHRNLLSEGRKAFAIEVQKAVSKRAMPLVFALADERDLLPLVIKIVRGQLKPFDEPNIEG